MSTPLSLSWASFWRATSWEYSSSSGPGCPAWGSTGITPVGGAVLPTGASWDYSSSYGPGWRAWGTWTGTGTGRNRNMAYTHCTSSLNPNLWFGCTETCGLTILTALLVRTWKTIQTSQNEHTFGLCFLPWHLPFRQSHGLGATPVIDD